MTIQAVPALSFESQRQRVDANIRGVVRVLLAWRGESRDWLAEQIGMTRSTLYRRIAGDSEFTAVEVWRLAETFGVDVRLFYEGPNNLGNPPTCTVRDSNPEPADLEPIRLTAISVLPRPDYLTAA